MNIYQTINIRLFSNVRIFTGKASAIEACQRRVMNKNKTLKDNANLRIPPSIFRIIWWNSVI